MKKANTVLFTLAALVFASLVQSVSAQTTSQYRLIPHASWDCGMPDGIASPETGDLVLEIEIPLERAIDVGKTQYGMRRVAIGLEGSVKGPRFSGAVATGALDFELTLANGTIEVEQALVLQATDGTYIYVRNAGT